MPDTDLLLSKDFPEKKKQNFLISRILLRLSLKSFYNLDEIPSFIFGSYGKPYFIKEPQLFFNLSHSGNYIGIAFSDNEMGLDIECIKQRKNFGALCEKVLSESEIKFLEALSDTDKLNLFTLLWTAREALLKDSGLGLVGLSALSFDIKRRRAIAYDNCALTLHSYKVTDLLKSATSKAFFSVTLRKEESIEFFTIENSKLKNLASPNLSAEFNVNYFSS